MLVVWLSFYPMMYRKSTDFLSLLWLLYIVFDIVWSLMLKASRQSWMDLSAVLYAFYILFLFF
eukprot:UN34159